MPKVFSSTVTTIVHVLVQEKIVTTTRDSHIIFEYPNLQSVFFLSKNHTLDV